MQIHYFKGIIVNSELLVVRRGLNTLKYKKDDDDNKDDGIRIRLMECTVVANIYSYRTCPICRKFTLHISTAHTFILSCINDRMFTKFCCVG